METEDGNSVDELIENEWFIVRNSGEIPEIAYNSSLYFLERAADGPGIFLSKAQEDLLKKAASDRFQEIILRDMIHANVGRSIYRGIVRSICNYERFLKYCSRQSVEPSPVQEEAATILSVFLQHEYANISAGTKISVINCSYKELVGFASDLGVGIPPEYILFKQYCL